MSNAVPTQGTDSEDFCADQTDSAARVPNDELQPKTPSSDEAAASIDDSKPQAPSTTGGQLRAAREAAGMAVSDIAEVLRFSAHQIEALERDDYAHLAGSTLVRGMVRGYAKLLKIKPEPLLAGLDGEVKPTLSDVRAPSNIGVADKTTTVTRFSRGAIIAVGIFAVLFAAVAGYVYLMNDELPTKTAAVTKDTPTTSVTTPLVTLVPPPQTTAVSQDASALSTSTPVAETMVATGVPVNALVMDFDDLSWVEIADASQSIVFRGEFPKGTHRVVDGKPPFQVWIGRASVVRVSFGDRIIDLKAHSRDNVARLTVE